MLIRSIIDYFQYSRYIESIEEGENSLIVTTTKEFDKNELRKYFERKSRINFKAQSVYKNGDEDSVWNFFTYEFVVLEYIDWKDGGVGEKIV